MLVAEESRQDIHKVPQDRFVLAIDYHTLRNLPNSIAVAARKPTIFLIAVRQCMLVQVIKEDCAGSIAHWAGNHHITALPWFKGNTTLDAAFHIFCAIRTTARAGSCPMGYVLVYRSHRTVLAIFRINAARRNRITVCHHHTPENIVHPTNTL